MKKFLIAIAAVLLSVSCGRDSSRHMVVEGTVDPAYDGFLVYFCPQPHPTEDIVDSAVIRKGSFRFDLDADSCYIADLVVSRAAGARTERLLIAVEPGVLKAELSAESRASGTPLNDSLQAWKEYIMANVYAKEEGELAEAQRRFEERTFSLISNNPNPLGGFLYRIYGPAMTPQKRHVLDSLGINKFIPDVSRRKK